MVGARLHRDTRGALSAIAELERLEARMQELRGAFMRGKSSYYSQQELEALGVAEDPRVAPHLNEFLGQDGA